MIDFKFSFQVINNTHTNKETNKQKHFFLIILFGKNEDSVQQTTSTIYCGIIIFCGLFVDQLNYETYKVDVNKQTCYASAVYEFRNP